MTHQRITLITGASRGIGYAASLALAKAGHHVIATARTQGGLEELDDEITAVGGTVTLVQMDLQDRPALMNLASQIHQRWGRLDSMVANAGVLGILTPAHHLDEKIWDEVIDTNLSAIWRMIKAFTDLLQQSPSGRAVIVTSSAAHGANFPFWNAYSASKAGVEALAQSWAAEVRSTNLKVNLLDPGGVGTAMYGSAFPGADLKEMPQPEDIAPAFLKLTSEDCPYHGEVIRAADI